MEQKDNETYIQRYLSDGGDVRLVEMNGQKFLQVRWVAHSISVHGLAEPAVGLCPRWSLTFSVGAGG